jgi:hypothetical protein
MQKRPDPVKMRLKKMPQMRPDNQPVETIGGKRNPKQTVVQIAEPPHKASSANPDVIASSVLRSKIMSRHFTPPVQPRQKEFIFRRIFPAESGQQIKKRGRMTSL